MFYKACIYCSLPLSVKDSFEALSILVSFEEESLDPAHKIAMLLVHACLGCLLAYLLGLWSWPLVSFFSPLLWVLSFYKVWQSFIILAHVFSCERIIHNNLWYVYYDSYCLVVGTHKVLFFFPPFVCDGHL